MVRYHLNQNSTKTKRFKSCRGGKPSIILEEAMIFLPSLCRSFNDLLVVKFSEKINKY